jgi:hypothetical protein
MIVQLKPQAGIGHSLWRRRNFVESRVREMIGSDPRLKIFGVGLDRNGGAGEMFVTITAADEDARRFAVELIAGVTGCDPVGLEQAWSRFQLGDWMTRIYPERWG